MRNWCGVGAGIGAGLVRDWYRHWCGIGTQGIRSRNWCDPGSVAAALLDSTAPWLRAVQCACNARYQNTSFDMGVGMASGAFGTPGRLKATAAVTGNWERPIAISRTIVSYVLVCRRPLSRGGVGLRGRVASLTTLALYTLPDCSFSLV